MAERMSPNLARYAERMRRLIAAAALIVVLALAGCSAPAPEPEETPAGLGRITTIDQLVDAAVDAGLICNWDQTDVVRGAVASGACSDESVLMMFQDHADAKAVVDGIAGVTEEPLLFGENWVVNSKMNEELQAVLGGELVED